MLKVNLIYRSESEIFPASFQEVMENNDLDKLALKVRLICTKCAKRPITVYTHMYSKNI